MYHAYSLAIKLCYLAFRQMTQITFFKLSKANWSYTSRQCTLASKIDPKSHQNNLKMKTTMTIYKACDGQMSTTLHSFYSKAVTKYARIVCSYFFIRKRLNPLSKKKMIQTNNNCCKSVRQIYIESNGWNQSHYIIYFNKLSTI